jgi:hypothetical protein
MNTQRRGTTPPHNRVGAVTNSLRVESPSTKVDFFGEQRRASAWLRLTPQIRLALPCLHSSYPVLRSGTPETGLILF